MVWQEDQWEHEWIICCWRKVFEKYGGCCNDDPAPEGPALQVWHICNTKPETQVYHNLPRENWTQIFMACFAPMELKLIFLFQCYRHFAPMGYYDFLILYTWILVIGYSLLKRCIISHLTVSMPYALCSMLYAFFFTSNLNAPSFNPFAPAMPMITWYGLAKARMSRTWRVWSCVLPLTL